MSLYKGFFLKKEKFITDAVISGSLSVSQAKSQSMRKSNRRVTKTKKPEQNHYDNIPWIKEHDPL